MYCHEAHHASVCVCVCVCACVCIHTYMHACINTYIYLYIHMHTHIYASITYSHESSSMPSIPDINQKGFRVQVLGFRSSFRV
jgi:hypothetical protein